MSFRRLQNVYNSRKRATDGIDFNSSLSKRPIQERNENTQPFVNDNNDDIMDNAFNSEDYLNPDDVSAIYPGSAHTKFDFCMALAMLARKTKMSDNSLDKLLHLIKFFLPQGNSCPGNVRTFKKYLEDDVPIHGKPEQIIFCDKCLTEIKETIQTCKCRNIKSETALLQKFKVVDQVSSVLEKHSTLRKTYADYIHSQPTDVYIDALSGSARRQYPNDVVTLALYTDGIKISKSSSDELWILGATILDLPMKVRFSQKNFIILAAWYGSSKPVWPIIAKHVNKELGKLINFEGNLLPMIVLQVNADIPARASLLNCKQSGYHPCLRCNVRVQNERIMRYETFDNEAATSESYVESVEAVLNQKTNSTIACPKGYAAFDQLRIPECVTADVMHTVYGGPLKDDLIEVFKNSFISEMFNTAIQNIRWPQELTQRKLRVLSEINLYKATEWKSIILYLAAPLLLAALNQTQHKLLEKTKKQMKNIILAISGILLLTKDFVTENDIFKAKTILRQWFQERDELFSHNAYTPKVHEFTHLPDQVRVHGPLQASSCFGGENLLNRISKMITCRNGEVLLKQIAERSNLEIQLEKWKMIQNENSFKQLISVLQDKHNSYADTFMPPEAPIAQYLLTTNCLKSATIEGYEFVAALTAKDENDKDSYCVFLHNGTFKAGIVEYIALSDEKLFLQIQPLQSEILTNLYDTDTTFQNYFSVGPKMGSPVVLESNVISTKGFIINENTKSFFIPLAHIFEHN